MAKQSGSNRSSNNRRATSVVNQQTTPGGGNSRFNSIKSLGLTKEQSEGETWYEGSVDGIRIRILQETPGNNSWWNVEINSEYVRNADGRALSFETPTQAVRGIENFVDIFKK